MDFSGTPVIYQTISANGGLIALVCGAGSVTLVMIACICIYIVRRSCTKNEEILEICNEGEEIELLKEYDPVEGIDWYVVSLNGEDNSNLNSLLYSCPTNLLNQIVD